MHQIRFTWPTGDILFNGESLVTLYGSDMDDNVSVDAYVAYVS